MVINVEKEKKKISAIRAIRVQRRKQTRKQLINNLKSIHYGKIYTNEKDDAATGGPQARYRSNCVNHAMIANFQRPNNL